MNERIILGFTYRIEHVRRGRTLSDETVHNLMPMEGLNHLLDVFLKDGTKNSTWYVGLYEGNYTPQPTDTAALFPATATECTGYEGLTRPTLVLGDIVAGAVNNSDAVNEFVSTDDKTVYGGFISSAPAKGATTGVLISAARFPSPKPFAIGDRLLVTVGFTFLSV